MAQVTLSAMPQGNGFQATIAFSDGVSVSSAETYPSTAEAIAAAATKLLLMQDRLLSLDEVQDRFQPYAVRSGRRLQGGNRHGRFPRKGFFDSDVIDPRTRFISISRTRRMTDPADVFRTLITLTADIVAAHVANNSVAVADMPALIGNVHSALAGLGSAPEPIAERSRPAVSVRASVKPDYVICLEDGKKLKMLKRHLMTHYQMTPADYRAKWNLPADYPMVAPNYAEQRRTLAHKIGLGRKAKVPEPAVAAAPPEKRKPGRPRKKLALSHPTE